MAGAKPIKYCEKSLLRLIQQDQSKELDKKFRSIAGYNDGQVSYNKLITIAKVDGLNRLEIVALRSIWSKDLVKSEEFYNQYLKLLKRKD